MAQIEAVIREAIARGARRQVRRATGPLRREVRRLRATVRQLSRDLASMRVVADHWRRVSEPRGWIPSVSEADARAARLSPRLIRTLRTRLGLSQATLARLVGVSAGAVVQWERGRSAPAGPNRGALIGLRRVGRRDVRRLLASMTDGAPPRRRPTSRRVRRPARGRGRRGRASRRGSRR
jgi:hypothetical protein